MTATRMNRCAAKRLVVMLLLLVLSGASLPLPPGVGVLASGLFKSDKHDDRQFAA